MAHENHLNKFYHIAALSKIALQGHYVRIMKQRANTGIGLGGFWAGGLMDPLERPLELRNSFFFKVATLS